jgi:hypothetical protein
LDKAFCSRPVRAAGHRAEFLIPQLVDFLVLKLAAFGREQGLGVADDAGEELVFGYAVPQPQACVALGGESLGSKIERERNSLLGLVQVGDVEDERYGGSRMHEPETRADAQADDDGVADAVQGRVSCGQ